MVDRTTFLRAIREAPDDVSLRLIFADWLDEHDDPLGEFIRLQLELERLRSDLDNPRSEQLRQREEKMLHRHRGKWLGPVKKLAEYHQQTVWPLFRGGLVEEAWMSAKTFLEQGETVFRACPALHELVVHQALGKGKQFASLPLLSHLKHLTLAEWLSARDAVALSQSPHLGGLKKLRLWIGHHDQQEVCRILARCNALSGLSAVELIQLNGGIRAGEKAARLRHAADALADEFNRLRGEKVASVVRPFERLFPLRGEVGYGFFAGHLPRKQPALAFSDRKETTLVLFDWHGHFQDVRREPGVSDEEEDFEKRLRDELGFEAGLIRVHEFTTDPRIPRRRLPWFMVSIRRPRGFMHNVAVCLWPYFCAHVVENPDTPDDGYGMRKWREMTSNLHSVMADGECVLDCWNDYIVGRDGFIVAS